MLKITLATLVVSVLFVSCSDDKVAVSESGPAAAFGTRAYKLDPEAAAIQLSVYGAQMGTPDFAKFRFLMRALKSAGEFVQFTERNPGIEGGGTLCGVFAATANHEEAYELIRSIETDPKHTHFSALSVASCATETP